MIDVAPRSVLALTLKDGKMGRQPPREYVRHVAGVYCAGVQCCQRCKTVLVDNRGVAYLKSQGPPGAFAVNAPVWVSDTGMTAVTTEPTLGWRECTVANGGQ